MKLYECVVTWGAEGFEEYLICAKERPLHKQILDYHYRRVGHKQKARVEYINRRPHDEVDLVITWTI